MIVKNKVAKIVFGMLLYDLAWVFQAETKKYIKRRY